MCLRAVYPYLQPVDPQVCFILGRHSIPFMQNSSTGSFLPPPVELGPQLHSSPVRATAGLEASSRVEGYDVARAIAVLGMILVNGRQILLMDSHPGTAWFVQAADFLYGRPAVLFVILAGVGLSLMSRRAIASGEPEKLAEIRATLWKRSIVLYAMGMLFRRWWGADILHFYGVFLSTAALLLTLRGKWLWGLIASILLASGGVFLVIDQTPPFIGEAISRAGMFGDWFDDLFIDGSYPLVPWLMFLLIGLWLGRNEIITSAAVRRRLVRGALISLVAAELLGRLMPPLLFGVLGLRNEGVLEMLCMLNSFPMTPLFSISAVSGAVLILSLAMARPSPFLPTGAWRVLQNTGKFSLSIYVSHIFLFLWLESWLRGMVSVEIYPALAVSIILVCFFVVPAAADSWARNFGRGPLEWVLRQAAAKLW